MKTIFSALVVGVIALAPAWIFILTGFFYTLLSGLAEGVAIWSPDEVKAFAAGSGIIVGLATAVVSFAALSEFYWWLNERKQHVQPIPKLEPEVKDDADA